MIDLERNKKTKELLEAKGKRTQERSIYKPNQKEDFKISRGKFSDFLTCPRCFYLDRVKGLKPPGTPGWTLNETTDLLLKKEFDNCRERQIPHRLFNKYGLNHVVPYKHRDIDKWRNSLSAGLRIKYKNSNIILTGGLDDVWIDLNTQELIVVDYKSQSNPKGVNAGDYWKDPFHMGYKIQMDFYVYLLIKMGFQVKNTSYFLVCNADRHKEGFYGQMFFEEHLIPYNWNIDWIEERIDQMISLMNQDVIPSPNKSCNNCAYSTQYSLCFSTNEQTITAEDQTSLDVYESEKEKLNNQLIEKLKNQLSVLQADKNSYEEILTKPDILAEYTSQFFDEKGPYPISEYINKKNYRNAKITADLVNNNNSQNDSNVNEELKETKDEVLTLKQKITAYRKLLTEPNLLADYIADFFDEKGPYPINKHPNKENFKQAKELADYFLGRSNCGKESDEEDINTISKSITVALQTFSGNANGTGVLIKSENNIHTVLTARHVIQNHDFREDILLKTEIDNIVHIADKYSIRLFGDLDLASLAFVSQKNYSNVSIGNSSLLNPGHDIWISGYSDVLQQTHLLYPGKLMGRIQSPKEGKELIYSNPTRKGSSGGPVLNAKGQIVGINLGGFLDPRKDIEIESGINYGIPIEYFTGIDIAQDQKTKEIISRVNIGIREFINKNFTEALLIFNKIIDSDPNSHVSFFYRAKIKEELDDKEGAINDYLNVINIDSSFPGSYNNLGLIMFFMGNTDGALKNYDLGLKHSPEDPALLTNRGYLKMELGLIQDSLNDFNLSLKRNPRNSKCYALRGILFYFYFKSYQNALEDLNQAIKLDSKNWRNYLTRGRIKESLGDIQGTGDDIKHAKKLLNEFPSLEPISDSDRKLIKKYLE